MYHKARLVKNSLLLATSHPLQLDRVVTKHYCLPEEMPHYRVAREFLSCGVVSNNAIQEYLSGTCHSDHPPFYRYPRKLNQQPIWWQMPWGAHEKRKKTKEESIYTRRERKLDSFIENMKNIQKKGFRWVYSGPINVHLLFYSAHSPVGICIDGHHRLAALKALQGTEKLADTNIRARSVLKTQINETVGRPDAAVKDVEDKNRWGTLALMIAEQMEPRHGAVEIKL